MKLRAAVAGAGLMGYWHAKTIERIGGRVTAVFDLNEAAAKKLAGNFSGARVFTLPEALLDSKSFDVLHICTPLPFHFDLAADALTRDFHVFAEKPLTERSSETERLYGLALEHKVQLCPVHQFPFQKGSLNAARALSSIGRLHHFDATFCSAGGRGKKGAELDAIVADILPHPLSLMQAFAPGSIKQAGWSSTHTGPGEFHANLATLGTSFSILISLNSRPTTTTLSLRGSEGSIHLDLFHGFSVIESGQVSRWHKITHPFDLSTRTLVTAGTNLVGRALRGESAYPGLRELTARFYASIASGTEPPISRDDAVAIAHVRDLLKASFYETPAH